MSEQFNKMIVEGRLTKNPVFVQDNPERQKCTFSIANQRKGDHVNFFSVTAWGKKAEICRDNLCKGRHVLIEGELFWSKYTQRGADHETTFIGIRLETIRFLDERSKYESKENTSQN